MAGEGFDRSVVGVFKLLRSAVLHTARLIVKTFRSPAPDGDQLRDMFINTGLFIKPADRDGLFLCPRILAHRQMANGLVLHLRLPPGMTPQDLDRARDRLGFALGGVVSCRATNTPQVAELVVTRQEIAD